jgi:hypothetical protein
LAIDIEYDFRREDESYRARRSLARMAASRAFFRSGYGLMTTVCVAALAAAVLFAGLSGSAVIAGMALVLLWSRFRRLWTVARIADNGASPIYGRRTCRLQDDGIAMDSPHLRIWVDWASIREIEESPDYIEIYYDAYRAITLPRHAFPTEERKQEFLARLRDGAAAAASTRAAARPAPIRLRQLLAPLSAVLVLIAALLVWQTFHAFDRIQAIPDVRLSIDRTEALDDGIVVLGRVDNPSRSDWRLATLELQFFDKDGRFIDQCSAFSMNLLVKAGKNNHYKATCAVRDKQAPDRGNTILPATLKEYARIEVNPGAAFRAAGPSLFGVDD